MVYGLPGEGVMARTVFVNSKCEGCLHYDPQKGLYGLCLVGMQPATCGEGEMPLWGYSPASHSGPTIPGRLLCEPAPGEPKVVDGLGNEQPPSTEVVHLDSGTYDGVVKSIVEAQALSFRARCRIHREVSPGFGQTSSADSVVKGSCSCSRISLEEAAKSFWAKLPNRHREGLAYDALVAFIEKAMERVYASPGAEKRPPSAYLPGVHSPKSPVRKRSERQRSADAGSDAVSKGEAAIAEIEALLA